ncbi:hypothetical protein ACOSQ2_032108 [Xanthoceras sorbifolium]
MTNILAFQPWWGKIKGKPLVTLRRGWLALWNLNIPPKIKIFIWRVCHNAIPSLCNLYSRKIVVDPCCSRCGDAPESSAHALFWCCSVLSNCHAIPRSRNGMAYSLASLAFSSKEEFCWFNPEPSFFVGLL